MKRLAVLFIALGSFAGKHAPLKESELPPLVLMGTGRLDCTISNRENGRQQLTLTSGSGVAFDVAVTPILDGVVEIKDGKLTGTLRQAQGPKTVASSALNYRFTSHLANSRTFSVSGLSKVELIHLETKVSVNARKFRQDGGPGTAIAFTSDEMERQGVYIEFRGLFREIETKKRFTFRTIMGPPTGGEGLVTPTDSNRMSRIEAKRVMVEVQPSSSHPFTQIITTIRELD